MRTLTKWISVLLVCTGLALSGCSLPQPIPENLYRVNKRVSNNFLYVSDEVKHGYAEYWEAGVTGDTRFTGDCEEYAFAMNVQLNRMGIPNTMWVVAPPAGSAPVGELHALTCSDSGWCFDYDRVPFRKETSEYTWIMSVYEYQRLVTRRE